MRLEKIIKSVIDMKLSSNSLITRADEGASIASLYYVENTNKQNYYLKIQEIKKNHCSLLKEKVAYEWLSNQLLVPEVVFYELYDNYEVLCISEIAGVNFDKIKDRLKHEEIIKLYAKGLKVIHSIPVSNCIIINELDTKIEQAYYRMDNDLVNCDDFEDEYKEFTPRELFQLLIEKRPMTHEPVFTHGDYCFDNIILSNDGSIGYIDLGNSGIADRYQDIALAIRSIKHDYGDEYLDLFYDEYGIDEIDQERFDFYIILDEFS